MNTYKIIALINQIKKARLLTVDDSTVIPITTSERVGVKISDFYNEPINVLLNINWMDDRGDEHSIFFTESALDNADFRDHKIYLYDADGRYFTIALYNQTPCNIIYNW